MSTESVALHLHGLIFYGSLEFMNSSKFIFMIDSSTTNVNGLLSLPNYFQTHYSILVVCSVSVFLSASSAMFQKYVLGSMGSNFPKDWNLIRTQVMHPWVLDGYVYMINIVSLQYYYC